MMPLLTLLLLVVSLLNLGWGQSDLGLWQQGWSLNASQSLILWEIRLPRLLAVFLVGAGLAVSGVALQALFRNPLAEPGLVGVSSAAALGAVCMIVLGPLLWLEMSSFWLSLGGFAMAFMVTLLLYRLSSYQGLTQVSFMLLAGVALNALAAALTGLLVTVSDDLQMRSIVFWMMGSFSSMDWQSLGWLTLAIGLGFLGLFRLANHMDVFLLGEKVSQQMGFDPQPFKRQVMFLTALMVGAAVALVGVIGFVGLVVPHIMRLLGGVSHRRLLWASALAGASLLGLADWIAKTLISPAELPIGLLMSLIGAPFFLMMLLHKRQVL